MQTAHYFFYLPEIIKSQSFHKISDKFFLYYSEFINANTSLSWLSLWLSALEIVRPEENEQRKMLLLDQLFYKIYGKTDKKFPNRREWIRHKIHHGKYPEDWDDIEKDYEDMHYAIQLCLLKINPDIQKIYDLRSNFKSIPRKKKDIEWYNWIYLFPKNKKPLNLREIVKYDDTAFFEFQRKIKENLGITTDISKRSNDY